MEAYGPFILTGAVMSAMLNAGSNVLNQITEKALDAKAKPHRVLPRGLMKVSTAIWYAAFLYASALVLAFRIEPVPGEHSAFWCAAAAATATVLYFVKPFYLKSRGWWANVTIAVPRGCLLKVAGWACVASVADIEPWFIGLIFMLFLLGAATSKDFADMKADNEAGVRTLPVIYGAEKAARLAAPFFIFPWMLLAVGVLCPRPGGGHILLAGTLPTLGVSLALASYGFYVARLMRKPSDTDLEGNHKAWKHMYILMMSAQVGLLVCYFGQEGMG